MPAVKININGCEGKFAVCTELKIFMEIGGLLSQEKLLVRVFVIEYIYKKVQKKIFIQKKPLQVIFYKSYF